MTDFTGPICARALKSNISQRVELARASRLAGKADDPRRIYCHMSVQGVRRPGDRAKYSDKGAQYREVSGELTGLSRQVVPPLITFP
jgi:hypothetical protein